jgi:hypothetical protein
VKRRMGEEVAVQCSILYPSERHGRVVVRAKRMILI